VMALREDTTRDAEPSNVETEPKASGAVNRAGEGGMWTYT
jgi:hypothetical protein